MGCISDSRKKIVLGIDPGNEGAFGVVDVDGEFVSVVDMPIVKLGKRKAIDDTGVYEILKSLAPIIGLAVLEKVGTMPKQGIVSAFNFGTGWGIVRGILTALEIRHELVTPQRWKGAILKGQPKEKDASRVFARRLFPDACKSLNLKKHHGRADALLMALYGRRALL